MESGSREFSKAAGEALSQSHLSYDTVSPRKWPVSDPLGGSSSRGAGPGTGTADQLHSMRLYEQEAHSCVPHTW